MKNLNYFKIAQNIILILLTLSTMLGRSSHLTPNKVFLLWLLGTPFIYIMIHETFLVIEDKLVPNLWREILGILSLLLLVIVSFTISYW